MDSVVYRVVSVLRAVVTPLPIGTNRALLDLLWMLLGGHLLATRGAVIPALAAVGWVPARVRRAWAALGQGAWSADELLTTWQAVVADEGRWHPPQHGGDTPVAVDLTGFWRPRLRDCPTTHYHSGAGKALPAIPLGLGAGIGQVGTQRLGLPLALVRADASDPSPAAQLQALLTEAVARLAPDDVLVTDRGVGLAAVQAAGVLRYVVRLPQNFTGRRRTPPAYLGRGRPASRGVVVRPRPRTYRDRVIAATPPDMTTTWTEGGVVVRAETWTDLIRPDTPSDEAATAPGCTVVAVHDPRHPTPLLLATALPVTARVARDLDPDRWALEHLPLAAKQVLGAARQFVSAPATCQRLPEVTLIAGAILSYLAATTPTPATGCWDRQPRPTPGRLRRVLGRVPFPETYSCPARVREKAAVTAHLPTGCWGQRRPQTAIATDPAAVPDPQPTPQAA